MQIYAAPKDSARYAGLLKNCLRKLYQDGLLTHPAKVEARSGRAYVGFPDGFEPEKLDIMGRVALKMLDLEPCASSKDLNLYF